MHSFCLMKMKKDEAAWLESTDGKSAKKVSSFLDALGTRQTHSPLMFNLHREMMDMWMIS